MSVVQGLLAPTDFSRIWDEVNAIPGWLSEREAKLLYCAALRTPPGGQIVEVGSWRGRSTALLGHTGREITAIDPMAIGDVDADGYAVTDDDCAALAAVVGRFPNVDWLRCESTQTRLYKDIDLLYIDGDHQGDAPLKDFRHFQPLLKRGSLVAFHDFMDKRAVSSAVATLEREGTITQLEVAGLLYVGQVVNDRPIKTRILLAHPGYGSTERESYDSEKHSLPAASDIQVHIVPPKTSLLAHGFNDSVRTCIKRGGYDAIVILHSDISCQAGWIAKLWELAEDRGFDAVHATVPIKNSSGLSSTAAAYSGDRWQTVRRLTQRELHKLPATFDVDDLRAVIDPKIYCLLPNTGCLLVRTELLRRLKFPGFAILDRISWDDDEPDSEVVPEDWNFGFWCAENNLRVGCTREVRVTHWGRQGYSNNEIWGIDVDTNWRDSQAVECEQRLP